MANNKIHIQNANLHRDPKTGLAWIHDGSTGLNVSVHPNISRTGSVAGMKRLGYWGENDVVVPVGSYYYNISRFVCDKNDPFERFLANECMCAGCIARRS